jgi:hypothetical protein
MFGLHTHHLQSDNRLAGVDRSPPRSLAYRSAVDRYRISDAAQFLIDVAEAGRENSQKVGPFTSADPEDRLSTPAPTTYKPKAEISVARIAEIPRRVRSSG